MFRHHRFFALAVLSVSLAPCSAQESVAGASTPQWRSLFNGKDLTGWKVKIRGHAVGDNFGNTFRVEDGLLKVRYDKYTKFDGTFGHLFYERPLGDYRLRVEYRFVGDQVPGGPGWAFRNSGVMIHGQTPESMAKDQDFPASIEVQLLGGKAKGKRATANLCTPGTHVVMNGKLRKAHCTNSTSKTYRGDQWVVCEIEARGNSVKHIMDGKVVLEYTHPQLDDGVDAKRAMAAGQERMLRSGTISLQSESHPLDFRKVEIMDLSTEKGWTDLLTRGSLQKMWHTEGPWTQAKDGSVKLTPQKGEKGWRRFGSYLWLEGSYGDFEIEFDYRPQPKSNSGFYFHVGDEKSPVSSGIEVQIYDSFPKGKKGKLTDHDSGGIIPGVPPTTNAARRAGEWNHFRIKCHANLLTVQLNGVEVNRIKLDHPRIKGRPKQGAIGFQDHSLPLELRNMRLREL